MRGSQYAAMLGYVYRLCFTEQIPESSGLQCISGSDASTQAGVHCGTQHTMHTMHELSLLSA